MMVDGRYANETKTSSAWDERWVRSYYITSGGSISDGNNTNKNNARGVRGICPMGWHIPTEYEWAYMLDKINNTNIFTLQTELGFVGTDEGQKLKNAKAYTDNDPGDGSWHNFAGSDDHGFSALPAGNRHYGTEGMSNRGITCVFWLSTVAGPGHAWSRALAHDDARVWRYYHPRGHGFTVRCTSDV
jgi:uncharacterized protein (TIGR02145 family)